MTLQDGQSLGEAAIGERLEQVRLALLNACDSIAEGTDNALKQRLAPVRARVDGFIANVAIVGQIKAGKSSLVNCVTRRIGLMPSDINPWTSVVTRLYFGHPSGQISGGRFWFFDEEHWQRLATRGGKLGELTEGLLEDYKRAQLFDQVAAMRERARLRLSDKFETLLGKSHRYETITSEVMERYVCAGDTPEERVRNPAAGRYSDITHTAEIYFEREPFGCPLCVMDTPGTNDPLLIREEITQQNLEHADYFIVVLSAHQALSESDLRLIRILKALKREQIVVFVNRIDEVNDLEQDYDELERSVRSRLSAELGDSDVAVVLGSAAWATAALTGALEEVDTAAVREIANRKKAGLGNDGAYLEQDIDLADATLLASGLAELEAEISRLLYRGVSETLLSSTVDELLAVSRQVADQAALRLERLSGSSNAPPRMLSRGERSEIRRTIETRIQAGVAELLSESNERCDALLDKLLGRIADFAATQQKEIKADLQESSRAQTITLEVDALRDELKHIYQSVFTRTQDAIWIGLRSLNANRNLPLDSSLRDKIISVRIGTLNVISMEPKPEPLYRPVTLDFITGWLSSLFTRSDTRIRAAVEAVQSQFAEICNELVRQTREDFATQIEWSARNYLDDLERMFDELVGMRAVSAYDADQRETGQRDAQNRLGSMSKVIQVLSAFEESFGRSRPSPDA